MISRLTIFGFIVNSLFIAVALVFGHRFPGRQMVYSASLDTGSDIFLLDVNHRLVHNLTQRAGDDYLPVWSPAGDQIAFESWRDGIRGVYVMNADGSDLHRVTADPEASEYDPQWTPDGRGLIFRSYLRGSASTFVYRVRPDGSGIQAVAPNTDQQPPSAEREIVPQFIDGVWGMYVVEDNQTRQLFGDQLLWREPPQWSADDRYVAYVSAGADNDVFILTPDNAQLAQITLDGAPKSHLSWRP